MVLMIMMPRILNPLRRVKAPPWCSGSYPTKKMLNLEVVA